MPDLGEPPVFPSINLPAAPQLPRPVLEVPRAELPTYKPMVVPPSQLKSPAEIKGQPVEGAEDQPSSVTTPPPPPIPIPPPPSEIRYVDVPGLDVEVPLPSNEILVTATSTAVVSVAATLTATAIFKRTVSVIKPIVKQLWARLTKKKTSSDS